MENDFIERSVEHDDPESLLIRREIEENRDWLIAMLKGHRDPKTRAKELGITPEDLGFDTHVEHNEVREQIITRSFIESSEDGLRCRIDRSHSKVTITRTTTKRSK